MTSVLLVRHGQTDWNRDRIFRGRADVPLNAVGREEASRIGAALQGVNLDAAYSSPLSRAMETARSILEAHRKKPQIAHGLIDIDYGAWQGMPLTEVQEQYPELYQRWREKPHEVAFPGGERLDEVRERALKVLKRICGRHPGKTVLIVSHRVVNKVLLCAVLDLGNEHFWNLKQENCALNLFDYSEEGFAIHLLNDTCHLESIEEKFRGFDF